MDNYLHKKFAYDQVIVEMNSENVLYTEPESMTEMQYIEDLYSGHTKSRMSMVNRYNTSPFLKAATSLSDPAYRSIEQRILVRM